MFLDDEELVSRAQVDDPKAITELIERYQPKAYAIAYYLLSGQKDSALDIAQEAFLKAIKSIKSFRMQSTFSTWFYRIVVNTTRDFLRQQQKDELMFFPLGQKNAVDNELAETIAEQQETRGLDNPMATLISKELTQEVHNAMESLSEKQRLIFQLKVFQQMSIRDIAQVMEMSEGTVKSHLFRATQALREALKGWLEA
ncbi:MAG: sigma-70 family RNA polymerase sigma factor [Desulfobacterota bacterium]|nr:sigma-70 family RNA polymerase sigma factor [Thermodesulfobacteriota bacterium]